MKTLLRVTLCLGAATLANLAPPAHGQVITTGLRLHLDATAITGVDDGTELTNWLDVSGNSNNFAGVGDDRPFYYSDGINGLAAVQFGGGLADPDTKRMDLVGGGTGLDITGDELTVFVVVQFYSMTPGAEQAVLGNYNGGGTGYTVYKSRNTPTFEYYAGAGVTDGSIVVDEPTIFGGVKSATAVTMFQDGVEVGSTASTNPITSSAGPFTLGWSGYTDGPLRGYIGEILIYDRTLDSSEIAQVNDYLNDKWVNPVPEPSIAMLAVLGGIAVVFRRGRARK